MPSVVIRVADTADRGDYVPGQLELVVESLQITKSWGAQPATGTVRYVAAVSAAQSIAAVYSSITTYSYVEIVTPGHVFYGVCLDDRATDASGGKSREMLFADLRHYLQWDQIYAEFNRPETRLVPDGSGIPRRRRRWRHLLPANHALQAYTYTDAPLTASQVLGHVFSASTVGSPWANNYHPSVSSTPVLDLDFSAGVRLDNVLGQIADKLGLQFTLAGQAGAPYRLHWRRKGTLLAGEAFPVDGLGRYQFPAGADNCVQGNSATEAPTRLRVLGGRNLYQVLNLDLVPDWSRAWDVFWSEPAWIAHVKANFTTAIPGDVQDARRDQRADGLARSMTVGEYAASHPSRAAFADARRFAGLPRNDMPALLYLREVAFRCWRLPATVLGRAAALWRPEEQGLCRVLHDASGVMSADPAFPAEGAGYVITRGGGVDWGAFRVVNPNRFDAAEWLETHARWAPRQFRVGDGGGDGIPFIQFDEPQCDATDLLLDVDGRPVVNAAYAYAAPAVRASLTLSGETYSHVAGTGARDGVLNEPALRRESVWDASGAFVEEIGYADGDTADEKAEALAAPLLARQWTVYSGGFTRPIGWGDAGTPLHGMYDRVTVTVPPEGGATETVDFTNERRAAAFEPERRYERRQRVENLFPGQERLRAEAAENQALFRAARYSAGFRRAAAEWMEGSPGIDALPRRVTIDGGSGTLPAGTPLWAASSRDRAVAPGSTGATHKVFLGVTTRQAEPATGPVPVVDGSVVRARVHGGASGVAVHDVLGQAPGQTYLAAATGGFLRALSPVPAGTVALIEVERVGGGGGVTSGWFL